MVCWLTPCSCRDFPKEESRRFQVWKIHFPSWEHSLPHAGKKCLLPRGEAASASFPYHVIGKGKVDLYWSLGEAIQVANASYIGLRLDQYRFIPPIRIALFYESVLV